MLFFYFCAANSHTFSGHFSFATYLGKLVGQLIDKETVKAPQEETARFIAFCRDKTCHTYVKLAIEQYCKCLRLDLRHVYQALPRLLSLWFDFVSTTEPMDGAQGFSQSKLGKILCARLITHPITTLIQTFKHHRIASASSSRRKQDNGSELQEYPPCCILHFHTPACLPSFWWRRRDILCAKKDFGESSIQISGANYVAPCLVDWLNEFNKVTGRKRDFCRSKTCVGKYRQL